MSLNSSIYFKKVFKFKCSKAFSLRTKVLIANWNCTTTGKPFFNAVDDVLSFLHFDQQEQQLFLQLLQSVVIFLQNNFYVNFFDINIENIEIQEIKKNNRFIKRSSKNSKYLSYINFTLTGFLKPFDKKTEILW